MWRSPAVQPASPRALHSERFTGLDEVLALEIAELDETPLLVRKLLDRRSGLHMKAIISLGGRLEQRSSVPARAGAVSVVGGVERLQLGIGEHRPGSAHRACRRGQRVGVVVAGCPSMVRRSAQNRL